MEPSGLLVIDSLIQEGEGAMGVQAAMSREQNSHAVRQNSGDSCVMAR